MPARWTYETPRRPGSPQSLSLDGGVWRRWLAELLRGNTWANALFVTAIGIGFIHGWMKLHYRSSLITFAFDIPLTLSLLVAIFSVAKGEKIFPPGPISTALKLLLVTCAIYGVLPFGVPPLVSLAAFRGWSFIPLIFLLGYHFTRTARQTELFIYFLLALGGLTAIYGLRQSPEEIQRMAVQDSYLSYRLQGSFYGSAAGSHFRAFSTFVSSGAFGSAMAFCSLFALSRAVARDCRQGERWVMASLVGLLVYGVVLSGSRSALVMVFLNLIVVAWYRRSFLPALSAASIIGAAIVLGIILTRGGILERINTLMAPSTIISRVRIVLDPSLEYLAEHPLGGGLGRSGHGIPQLLMRLVGQFEWVPVDGDMGRLVIDMGIIGVVVFAGLLLVTARDAYRMMTDLRETPLAKLALPCGAWFIISAITVPIGSPFLGIPVGALTWFFVGVLTRLHAEYKSTGGIGESVATYNSDPFAAIDLSKDRMLTFKSKRSSGEAGVAPPASQAFLAPNATPPPRPKRFLYRRSPAKGSASSGAFYGSNASNERRNRRPRL